VKDDEDGKVVEVREKNVYQICVLWAPIIFSSVKLYQELYEECYADDSQVEQNEKYIAPLYNLMIAREMEVTVSIVSADRVHVMGTPEELGVFLASDTVEEKSQVRGDVHENYVAVQHAVAGNL